MVYLIYCSFFLLKVIKNARDFLRATTLIFLSYFEKLQEINAGRDGKREECGERNCHAFFVNW